MEPHWALSNDERATLAAALDALLPPDGSFPPPSATGIIDDFILVRVPAAADASGWVPYPFITANDLRAMLRELNRLIEAFHDIAAALHAFEQANPAPFLALWRLAVYGYYSRPETIAAVARDHAPAYHGAPLPLGYAHAMAPWDASDPLQMPRNPRGAYVPTEQVQPIDRTALPAEWWTE